MQRLWPGGSDTVSSGLAVTPPGAPAEPLTRCQRKVSPATRFAYVQPNLTCVAPALCAVTTGCPGAVAPGPSAFCSPLAAVDWGTPAGPWPDWPLPWLSEKNATTATTATSTPPPSASTRPLGRPRPVPA